MKTIFYYIVPMIILSMGYSCGDDDNDDSKIGEVEKTDWQVPISENFEYSMTFISQISFNGTVSNNEDIEVAAFYSEECRGMAKLVTEEGVGTLCFLTIYSNSISGEKINLKVFDPEYKTIYVISKTLDFKNNELEGSSSEIINCIRK